MSRQQFDANEYLALISASLTGKNIDRAVEFYMQALDNDQTTPQMHETMIDGSVPYCESAQEIYDTVYTIALKKQEADASVHLAMISAATQKEDTALAEQAYIHAVRLNHATIDMRQIMDKSNSRLCYIHCPYGGKGTQYFWEKNSGGSEPRAEDNPSPVSSAGMSQSPVRH